MTIKEAREGKKLTQTELAKITGVSVRTIQNWESGISTPSEFLTEAVLYRIQEYKTPEELETEGRIKAAYVEKGRQVGYIYRNLYKELGKGEELKRIRTKLTVNFTRNEWSKLLKYVMLMQTCIDETVFFDNIFEFLERKIEDGGEISDNFFAYITAFLNALGDSVYK